MRGSGIFFDRPVLRPTVSPLESLTRRVSEGMKRFPSLARRVSDSDAAATHDYTTSIIRREGSEVVPDAETNMVLVVVEKRELIAFAVAVMKS